MTTRLRDLILGELGELRYEPIHKRIRAMVGDATVVDSTHALLVWEPRRVVPSYAVPATDLHAELGPARAAVADDDTAGVQLGERRVLDPSIPFSVHSTDGDAVVLRADGREIAGFRPAAEGLDDHVVLDFDGFDAWYEEDERNVAHPRDPFHRIDVVHSSRHVRIERDGETLAESSRPYLLFETPPPARFYLPADDVRTDLLRPTDTSSWCAYKGQASYWAFAD